MFKIKKIFIVFLIFILQSCGILNIWKNRNHEIRKSYYEDGWHGTWAQDGGVINQQAIHHVDAINWLLGPIDSLTATISNQLNDLEAEDTLVAIMKFENGALGTIEATTAARPEDFAASL